MESRAQYRIYRDKQFGHRNQHYGVIVYFPPQCNLQINSDQYVYTVNILNNSINTGFPILFIEEKVIEIY